MSFVKMKFAIIVINKYNNGRIITTLGIKNGMFGEMIYVISFYQFIPTKVYIKIKDDTRSCFHMKKI